MNSFSGNNITAQMHSLKKLNLQNKKFMNENQILLPLFQKKLFLQIMDFWENWNCLESVNPFFKTNYSIATSMSIIEFETLHYQQSQPERRRELFPALFYFTSMLHRFVSLKVELLCFLTIPSCTSSDPKASTKFATMLMLHEAGSQIIN